MSKLWHTDEQRKPGQRGMKALVCSVARPQCKNPPGKQVKSYKNSVREWYTKKGMTPMGRRDHYFHRNR